MEPDPIRRETWIETGILGDRFPHLGFPEVDELQPWPWHVVRHLSTCVSLGRS